MPFPGRSAQQRAAVGGEVGQQRVGELFDVGIVGSKRGAPDIALIGDPNTGIWVYDTTKYNGQLLNWSVWGGTSVASPAVAAIVNSAGKFNTSSVAELTEIYKGLGNKKLFTDITKGTCGNTASGMASVGYDLCTGVGTPLGLTGK